MIFEDEASFRQDSTLHATWSRRGCQPEIPVTGQRNSVKIFGAIELFERRFSYSRATVFNSETYLDFLEDRIARKYYPRPVIYIHDNASYHTEVNVRSWFDANRSWLEVHNLPPYSPEFNAQEPLWKYVRKTGTHNRFFSTEQEIVDCLTRVFRSMQRNPRQIEGYLQPFL